MAGIISKGIKLEYSEAGTNYTEIDNVRDIPDLGGSVDTIETTVLSDEAHTFTNGLKDYGGSIDFTLLYDKTSFMALADLDGEIFWRVTFPDGLKVSFKGQPSIRTSGTGTNDVIEMVLSVTVSTKMNPSTT